MTNAVKYYDIKQEILKRIKKNNGWVNAHAHIDRAFSVDKKLFRLANAHRHEKWKLNANLRKTSTVNQIYDRMAKATELMIDQGVRAIASFVDVDYDVKDKAIKAAQKIKDKYSSQITFKFINQSSYGILDKKSREWFEIGAEFADIVGGLTKVNEGRANEYLDIIMQKAKEQNKMTHLHVDELNDPNEIETEILAKKTIEHGMEGRVVAIHALSINAHPKEYRDKLYKLIKKSKLIIVSCPMSWLNSRRSETMAPIHSPIAPVDEMIPLGIPVAIGTDNIADLFMPLNDGIMWNDLRALIEENRLYDVDSIVKIATTNGLKALGLAK